MTMPETTQSDLVERQEMMIAALEDRASHAENRLHSFRKHQAARYKKLAEFIKLKAPDLWPDYAAMSANGSVYSNGEWIDLGFEREMNSLNWRVEEAEKRATELRTHCEAMAEELHQCTAVLSANDCASVSKVLTAYRKENPDV